MKDLYSDSDSGAIALVAYCETLVMSVIGK